MAEIQEQPGMQCYYWLVLDGFDFYAKVMAKRKSPKVTIQPVIVIK